MGDDNQRKVHEEIFNNYYKYVRTIVFNKLRSVAVKEDIDDCVSEIFADIFVYCGRHSVKTGEMKGIVCGIARNKATDYFHFLSKNTIIPIEEAEVCGISSAYDTEKENEKSEIQIILLRLIKSLGEPDSTIVMQRYYYNQKSEEIGKKLDMKPFTVRKRCSRAMEKLKEMLKNEGITL